MVHGVEHTTNGKTAAFPRTPEAHHRADSSTHTTTKESNTMDAHDILNGLAHFTGTENYFSLGAMFCNAVYTDGVQFLIENAQCAWLVTDAMAWVTQKVPGQNYDDGFMTVELHPKEDGTAVLLITDGNGTALYTQHYTAHTFPLPKGIKLYAVWGETSRGPCWILMVTSEY